MSVDQVIAKFRTESLISKAVSSGGFGIVGLGSSLWIGWQIAHPDFYLKEHEARFVAAAVLCVVATIYVVISLMYYLGVLLHVFRFNNNAVVRRNNLLSFEHKNLVFNIVDIKRITPESRDSNFGIPARLKIETCDGSKNYIRCDGIDLTNVELADKISEMMQLMVPDASSTKLNDGVEPRSQT